MFDCVLILSVSIGGGHMRAAQALEKAFFQLDAAREVRIVDTLDYINKLFRKLFLKAYVDVIKSAPGLYGWFYEHFDTPWQNQGLLNVFEKLNTRPLLKLLEKVRPDLVICVHALPAGIISWLRERYRADVPQAIVTTDFDVHAMWLCDHYEHYFVALDETKLLLEALGVPANKVTATGIPIDPVFAEDWDKAEARKALHLDPDLATILVTGGSLGLGPMEQLMRALQQLKTPMQIVAVCGRNEPLKATIDQILCDRPGGPVKMVCIGWTDQMHMYMVAADLVAGKTGGLTASEALASGLPFLVVNPIQGQEQRNADHLLEECAAIRCNNLPVLAYKVEQLLGDRERLARMQANARRLSRPRAAFDIVRKLAEIRADGLLPSLQLAQPMCEPA
jgi:processive 1,2-diacylglycerol beta-glucosyltransferase